MDESGRMNKNAGPYEGLERFACREKSRLKILTAQKLVKKVETYVHNIGLLLPVQRDYEPFLSKQWFVKTTPLAKPAIDAVKEGRTRIIPSVWGKKPILSGWKNIRDWCISRQIWWGIEFLPGIAGFAGK